MKIRAFFLSQRKYIFISFLAGFILTVTTLVSHWYIFGRNQKTAIITPLPDVLAQQQTNIAIGSDVKTLGVLLFGYGGAGHDGGYLTDALQVLYIDFEKATVGLISIPRDLWVQVPGGQGMKINNALIALSDRANKDELVTSGAAGLKQIIADVTGLPINYFVGVDFVGYQRAIGINLGGIDVDVHEALDDPWYPIKGEELNLCGMSPEEIKEVHEKYSGFELERQFTCRYKHVYYPIGQHHMEGGDALEFVRSRHGSAEGDVSRGKRQQEVIQAISKKLFSLEALDKLPEFFNEIVTHTQTDVDLDIVQYLSPLLRSSRDFRIVTLNLSPTNVLQNGTAANGAYIMTPRSGQNSWTGVHTYIKDTLGL